jgi:hypothetical protein
MFSEPVVSSTTSKIELAGFTASPVPLETFLKSNIILITCPM